MLIDSEEITRSTAMAAAIRYLVFDIESVADPTLVARLRYPGESLEPAEAIARYRAELMEKYESDFVPYTFQVPVSVAVGKVAEDYVLADVVVLDEPQFRPHVIAEHFWRGWDNTAGRRWSVSTGGASTCRCWSWPRSAMG